MIYVCINIIQIYACGFVMVHCIYHSWKTQHRYLLFSPQASKSMFSRLGYLLPIGVHPSAGTGLVSLPHDQNLLSAMVTEGALTQHVEQAQHVQQGSCARFHWHVGHGYSFNPAGVPVDTCEEVTERMRLGKWANNVYMNVVETEVTDGRACGMRPLCVAGF